MTNRATAWIIGAVLIGAATPAAAREHVYAGETFDCRFPKAGHVVIDTREPNSSITVNGRRWAASSGSYFYQATSEGGPYVMFGPNMRWWEYGIDGQRATSCKRTKNASERRVTRDGGRRG